MRNGFTAGFGYFLGRKKNLEKKKHFFFSNNSYGEFFITRNIAGKKYIFLPKK
jgi:hypothetical protein